MPKNEKQAVVTAEFSDLESQIATSSWGTLCYGGQVGFTKMDAAQIRRIKAAAFSPR